jgi:murein DD-endopeptidase MepM/ murein hydrolase activator NlpD
MKESFGCRPYFQPSLPRRCLLTHGLMLTYISSMKTDFTEILIHANAMDPADFQSWVFYEEMLFNAPGKWWGDYGLRDFPHEGIDLCLYTDGAGEICRLNANTRIPAMHDGVVKALFKDYLGQAIIIEHLDGSGAPGRYLSAYAHIIPQPGIEPGAMVKRGDIIAAIADTQRSKANILPHLHYSLGRPSPRMVYDPFEWNLMCNPDLIMLFNPIDLIEWPSQILASKAEVAVTLSTPRPMVKPS